MLRNRIPRNAVVRGPLSFLFRFLFFFSFRSIVASMEYVGARIYRTLDTIEEKIIIEKSGKRERCIRRGLDLAAFSYTACTYIRRTYFACTYFARIARKGYEANDRNTGGRGSVVEKVSRFLAILRVRLRYPVYEVAKSISRAFSRAKKPERGERRTSNAFRAAEEIVIASDSSTHGRWKEAEARSS